MIWTVSLVLFISNFVDGANKIVGDITSECAAPKRTIMDDICEEDGVPKYVRIKTYHDRYIYCGTNDYNELKTRCCGAKDAVGRTEILTPGRRTTFIVHCIRNDAEAGGKDTVAFEPFDSLKNEPLGRYFFVPEYYDYIWPEPGDYKTNSRMRFVLHQWRGPVVGIESVVSKHWLSLQEGRETNGRVYGGGFKENPKTQSVASRPTPHLEQTFTIEIVPKECVDVTKGEKIQADASGKSQKSCEDKPDRCYWANIWVRHNEKEVGRECFYKKDSMCFVQPGDRTDCGGDTSTAEKCETAGCCYDYERNACYKGVPLSE